MNSKFQFYEIVKVTDSIGEYSELSELDATIIGMAEDESGKWFYTILPLNQDETWYIPEYLLVSTNKFAKPEDIYDGSSVKITVDDEGKGKVK